VLGLLDIGPWEMLLVAIGAILLFGGDLPDVARRAGQMLGRLRNMASDLARSADLPPDVGDLPHGKARMPAELARLRGDIKDIAAEIHRPRPADGASAEAAPAPPAAESAPDEAPAAPTTPARPGGDEPDEPT
jgi:Sec-independent protein translocase protein TatA